MKLEKTKAVALLSVATAASLCAPFAIASSDTPVVGGYVVGTQTNVGCPGGAKWHYDTNYHMVCPDGDPVRTLSNRVIDARFGTLNNPDSVGIDRQCPANTARIMMPNGYQAPSGQFYGGAGSTTYVCAKSDTYGN